MGKPSDFSACRKYLSGLAKFPGRAFVDGAAPVGHHAGMDDDIAAAVWARLKWQETLARCLLNLAADFSRWAREV